MNNLPMIISTLTAVAGVLTALVSLVKAIQATSQAKAVKEEADAIKAARVLTQAAREKEYQELKTQQAVDHEIIISQGKRLDEGNNKFDLFERELKENNGLLRELIGVLKASGFKVGGDHG